MKNPHRLPMQKPVAGSITLQFFLMETRGNSCWQEASIFFTRKNPCGPSLKENGLISLKSIRRLMVPDTVKFEAETLTNMAYDMSNTPRISFETLKGVGKASGTFRFMFMGAHMSVSNHAEVIGEFLQRRVNFLVSALGSINPSEFDKASNTIDIETEIQPFMLDDLNDKVTTAVSAVSGGIWSTREGIMFAGNSDRLEEELAEIKEEQEAKNSNTISSNAKG